MIIMNFIAQLFKALSEPVRLRILTLLLENERCVCELMAALDLPQSTISRHLAYMKNAGWVEGERRGVWMYYRLTENKDEFRQGLRQVLAAYLPQTKVGAADLFRLQSHLLNENGDACR